MNLFVSIHSGLLLRGYNRICLFYLELQKDVRAQQQACGDLSIDDILIGTISAESHSCTHQFRSARSARPRTRSSEALNLDASVARAKRK